MEIVPRLGHSGRSPMVATILWASAANCSSVKAITRAAPVVAEVILRCAQPTGDEDKSGGVCLGSNGHTTCPHRQALKRVNTNCRPWGNTTGSDSESLSVAAANWA